MEPSVFSRVEALLSSAGVPFKVLHHEPVFTSEEAARVRGVELSSGAKALVCKADEEFLVFVLPADRRLDSRGVRRKRGLRRLRFANREEVLKLTGLMPGSIPPFGSLFGLATLCDERLGENESINFNAGDHSVSVRMLYADYLRVEGPELGSWAEGVEGA
jgi:Ala-tRNA(Pro) deacylase